MIERLPKSLKELNYKTYVSILNKIPDSKPDFMDATEWSRLINLSTLSIMLGVSENEIEALKAVKVAELIKTISYLDFEPKQEKTGFKVKAMGDLTYDEFVRYQTLRVDQWNNLAPILLILVKDITKEQIDNLSAHDAIQIFFCLNASIRKSLKRLKYSTLLRLMKQLPKMMLCKLLYRK